MQRCSSIVVAVWLCAAAPAAAQGIPGFERVDSDAGERIGEHHWKRTGNVKLVLSGGTTIFADAAEVFLNEDRAVATGNVVFTQGTSQISADRVDFNIKTRLGTFYNANGMATFQPPRQTSPRGIAPAPVSAESTDIYFFGETIEKIGPKKYKITHGGFTTCVQPTPRWDLHADTVVLNIDHYTLLHQAVLKAKGVPLLYLPALYYPTKKDQRATGFLIPTYGSSTLLGQQIHNAFFWAIDRSQDATFAHEYSSRTGQGTTGEYRYNFGDGSDGEIKLHLRDQHEAHYTLTNGKEDILKASRSYDLRGGAKQLLPGHLRASATVDYFSSITTNQTYSVNIADASRGTRKYGGSIAGNWNGYSLAGAYDHIETFSGTDSSTITGGSPKLAFSTGESPLLGSPAYFVVKSEYVHLLRETKKKTTVNRLDESDNGTTVDNLNESNNETTVDNQNLTRIDFSPQVQFAFKKLGWLSVSSSFNWRDTFYTRSLDANPANPAKPANLANAANPADPENPPNPANPAGPGIVADPVNRRFFTAQAQIIGPVFGRIFDTPDSSYAEQLKHTIEPSLTVQRTSAIDNYSRIAKTDPDDSIVGGTTTLTYGVKNMLLARRRQASGLPSSTRELVSVDLTQSYYTNGKAAQVDARYLTSAAGAAAGIPSPGAAPGTFSPIHLSVRATPTNEVNATFTAEFDSHDRSLRTIYLTGSYKWTNRVETEASWSTKFRIPRPQGAVASRRSDDTIRTENKVHTKDNRVGCRYSFDYDVLNSRTVQQRLSGFYNAQCCGIKFEYQSYNLDYTGSPVRLSADRRFFLSFTLAGLGNFSPFNGALSGVPR